MCLHFVRLFWHLWIKLSCIIRLKCCNLSLANLLWRYYFPFFLGLIEYERIASIFRSKYTWNHNRSRMTDSFAKSRYHRVYVVAYNELYKIVLMALCMRIEHTYELCRAYRPMFTDFTWCIIVKNKTEFHFYLIFAMWNGVVLSICENVKMWWWQKTWHTHTLAHTRARNNISQRTERNMKDWLVHRPNGR